MIRFDFWVFVSTMKVSLPTRSGTKCLVMTVIKRLLWGAPRFCRDRSGHSHLSRPTASTSLEPRHHLHTAAILVSAHGKSCSPSFHFSHLKIGWNWVCVSWIPRAERWCESYIHHVRRSGQCGQRDCVWECERVTGPHYFFADINTHIHESFHFYLWEDFHTHNILYHYLP